MKKIHVSDKKHASSSHSYLDHRTRRITLGIALTLLGVLTVLNLLTQSGTYEVHPVQGSEIFQSK